MDRTEHGQARSGRLTGSMAHDLMHGSWRAWNTLLENIRNPRPFYGLEDAPNMPAPLAWGQTHEREAAGKFWELHPELEVHDPRFLRYHDKDHHLRYERLGVSPDRMLSPAGQDGYTEGLEIKCPYQQAIFYEYANANYVPQIYKAQCYFGMLVSGLTTWRFFAYDPRTKENYEVQLISSPSYLDLMEAKVDEFLEVLDSGETFTAPEGNAKNFEDMF